MPDDDTDEVTDGRPKIFNNLTAWIGGATAVVVALGGLAGAYRNMFPSEHSQQGDANSEASAAESAPLAEEAEQGPVTAYATDDGGSIRLIEGMWVWTTKEGDVFRYKELSNDGTTTVAVLKGGGENGEDVYLRWPNAGGQAFQSFDEQATWTDPVNLTPQD